MTTMNNEPGEALKACPFCGGPAEKRLTDGPKRGFIGCFTCMIGLPFNAPYGNAEIAAWNARSASTTAPPMCAVHAALDGKDKLTLEVGNGCIACSLHERTALLNLLEPFAADDASQDSLTVLRNLIASRAPLAAVKGDAEAKAKAIVEEYKQRVVQLPSGDAVPCAKWLETRLRIAFDLAAAASSAPAERPPQNLIAVRDEIYQAALGELCDPDLLSGEPDWNTVAMRIADKTAESLQRKPATPPTPLGCCYPEPDGDFNRSWHTWKDGRCTTCGILAEPLQPEGEQEK